MKRALLIVVMFVATAARAQDAIIVGANADRGDDSNGGGASLHWVRTQTGGTLVAGALVQSLGDTRWGYGIIGGSRTLSARTMLTGEANIGRGRDDQGGFRYLLLRGGVTQQLLPQRLSGELEWLQSDVARQRDGILRVGATATPQSHLTLRASHYDSLSGGDTSLTTLRADYDLQRATVIAGIAYGRAAAALRDLTGSDPGRVRDLFGGVRFGDWTVVATAGRDRQRLAVSRRIPLPFGGSRP